MNIFIPIFTVLLPIILLVRGQSSTIINSPLLDPSVIQSPAFITADKFYQAMNSTIPFLPNSLLNATLLQISVTNKYAYPNFMNYAVKIANITNVDELSMYLAQVVYQSNGLTKNCDPACSEASNPNCAVLKLNTTVYGSPVNYYGRGYLWVQGQSAYTDCNKDLFGQDSTLLLYPDAIRDDTTLTWAATAWYWKRFVQPNMSSFGSTVKIIRPSHCNGSASNPKPEATNAWNMYVAILKILAPTSPPSSSYC